MSSTDSQSAKLTAGAEQPAFRSGFDTAFQGVRAECDGGRALANTKFAGRQEFMGTLTGEFRDYGPYPWRWYLLNKLTKKPEGFAYEAVWCGADSLTLFDEQKESTA